MIFKSGFVAIVGKTNSGKSTLINKLVNKKVSIATRRINTTRVQVRAIYNSQDSQIVFLDTPGFLKINTKLDKKMNNIIKESLEGVEVILFLIPFWDSFDEEYLKRINIFKNLNIKKFCLLTQIDRSKNKAEILEKIDQISKENIFDEIIPISSVRNINIDILIEKIKSFLPEAHPYYEKDKTSDISDSDYVSEIIREKCLLAFSQEIPHQIFVKTKKIQKKGEIINIFSEIIVARESLKSIVIGKKGEMIKKIGIQSRSDLEKYFNKKVFLETKVKVEKDWMNNDSFINNL